MSDIIPSTEQECLAEILNLYVLFTLMKHQNSDLKNQCHTKIPLIQLRMLESILAGAQVSAPIQYLIIYWLETGPFDFPAASCTPVFNITDFYCTKSQCPLTASITSSRSINVQWYIAVKNHTMWHTNILRSCRRILWYDSWLTWMIISATHFSFPLKTNGLKSL